jgi:hypothetical protein
VSDRESVRAVMARSQLIVAAMSAGVLVLAAVVGFVDLDPVGFAALLSLPAGLAGLITLVAGWNVFKRLGERAVDVQDVASGCTRYTAALLISLALTQASAFLGIVAYMLGAEVMALTGVLTHVLLTAVLWPTVEKIKPFLGHAGQHLFE